MYNVIRLSIPKSAFLFAATRYSKNKCMFLFRCPMRHVCVGRKLSHKKGGQELFRRVVY